MSQTDIGLQWDLAGMAHTILSPCARQILKYWIQCPEFLDESQHPVMLRTEPSAIGGFQALVHEVNPEVTPAVILNELQRKEIIELMGNGQIFLKRSAYMVSLPEFQNESYEHGASNLKAEFRYRRYDDAK